MVWGYLWASDGVCRQEFYLIKKQVYLNRPRHRLRNIDKKPSDGKDEKDLILKEKNKLIFHI
jgi:hypothetical protein